MLNPLSAKAGAGREGVLSISSEKVCAYGSVTYHFFFPEKLLKITVRSVTLFLGITDTDGVKHHP